MRDLKKRLRLLIAILVGSFALFIALFVPSAIRNEKALIIGAKNCTEQQILGEILAQLIEKKTDLQVTRRFFLEGSAITFQALLSGGIDVYFEYTGTALLDLLKEPLPKGDLLPLLRKLLNDRHQLKMLEPLGFSNEYRLVARADGGWTTLSDLENATLLKVAYDPEFSIRPERRLLEEEYPFLERASPKLLDQVFLYFSLLNRHIDVISAASTDSRLYGDTFIILQDDRECLPSYQVAPLLRKEVLEKFPILIPIFEQLAQKISVEEMRRLNYLVDCERREVAEVAREFLSRIDVGWESMMSNSPSIPSPLSIPSSA